MSERKAGDRYIKEVNRQGVVTWSVFEWKILAQVGPLEACLVAGGLSRSDAELLAHGRERIARLEAALRPFAQMCGELDRPGLPNEYGGDMLWTIGQLREARAALADARDQTTTT